MKIAVAQLGARRHYAVPSILEELDLLSALFTDTYIGNKPLLARTLRALPQPMRPRGVDRWLGREAPHIPPSKIKSYDPFGVSYAWKRSRTTDSAVKAKLELEYSRGFNRRIIRTGIGDADTVWGFNGVSLELFKWAKEKGLRCILDQTLAPRRVLRSILAREKVLWPNWQPDLAVPTGDDALACREEEEWDLADLILCGSKFVADGIARCGGPGMKCRVVPYGVSTALRPLREVNARAPRKLHVLFVGEVGLRKGIPYLLEALRKIGTSRVSCRIVGSMAIAASKRIEFSDVAEFFGAVPRRHMRQHFEWADVLVLPSTCEGSAIVIYEAVVAGLQVICTPAAGALEGPSVTILEKADVDEICRAIELASEQSAFGGDDRGRAAYTLAGYRQRLHDLLLVGNAGSQQSDDPCTILPLRRPDNA